MHVSHADNNRVAALKNPDKSTPTKSIPLQPPKTNIFVSPKDILPVPKAAYIANATRKRKCQK